MSPSKREEFYESYSSKSCAVVFVSASFRFWMSRFFYITSFLLWFFSSSVVAIDWNQWRGYDRNGVVKDGVPLLSVWAESGPNLLWRSETIPSGDNGGHGSVLVNDGKTYISLVWHDDKPSENREINDLILRKLGYRNLSLSEQIITKMEKARESISPRLRGRKLNDWAEKWISDNLSKEQAERNGSWIISRFKKGGTAVPYEDMRHISEKGNKRFQNDAALKKWIDAQPISSLGKQQLIKAIPNTVRVAKDVILCLDSRTGRRLWKTEAPGEPTGRKSSSTPCIAGGRLFAAGSTHVYCVDAVNGRRIWSAPLPKRGHGPASSILFHNEKVFLIAGNLVAYNAKTGRQIWINNDVRNSNSSPLIWSDQDGKWIICSERKAYVAVNPNTGDTVWKVAGGGDSTPVISGNWMVVYSKEKKVGLAAYRLSKEGAKIAWKIPMSERRAQSSPLIYGGHVYLIGGDWHICADLATGKLQWRESRQSTISSPIIADGKIIALEKKGSDLVMIDTDIKAHRELGKSRIKAMWCPSPVIVEGKLYLRMKDNISCYDLRAEPGVQ